MIIATASLSWFVSVSLALSLVLLLLKFSSKHATANPLPPGPKTLPIIGNLHLLGDKPHRSLAHLAKSYGPIMSLKLGQVTTVVISSPDLAREVLSKSGEAFSSRWIPDTMRALNHHKASLSWLPPTPQWKNLRTICTTQLFTSRRLDENKGLRQQKVGEMVDYLRESAQNGRAVDIGRVAFTAVLNMMTNTFFSVNLVEAENSLEATGFKELMWELLHVVAAGNVSDFFPVVRRLDLQGRRRKTAGYMKRLHEIIDGFIDQRLDEIKVMNSDRTIRKDFLDTLIHLHLQEKENKLDRQAIRSLLLELLVAGSDSTSITIEWAIAELLRNPSLMAKTQSEVKNALGKDMEIDESDISKLPYLQAVVKETFRLHPAAPLLVPRMSETDVKVAGFTVPGNTRILVNVWAFGRDKTIWRDAEEFIPERFLDMDVEYKGRDFELIPFGAGRRICPGMPLASRMVHLILATLLRSFDWKLKDSMKPEDVDMTDKFGLTCALATPLEAVPVLVHQ